MKIDYAAIALRAIEIIGAYTGTDQGRLDLAISAWDVMSVEKGAPVRKDTFRVNRLDLYRIYGFGQGQAIVGKIRAAINAEPNITDDSRVFLLLQLDEDGLDLVNADVRGLLASWGMNKTGGLTADEVSALDALTYDVPYVWPDLKQGQVHDALEKLRKAGEI